MPLFLLWKEYCTLPRSLSGTKYLIGGSVLSNQFSNFSKSWWLVYEIDLLGIPIVSPNHIHLKEFKVKLKAMPIRQFVFDENQADLN